MRSYGVSCLLRFYRFSLGYLAAVLIDGGKSGYLATLSNLHLPVEQWTAEAIPLTSLIDIKPVQHLRSSQQPPSNENFDLHFRLTIPALRCSLESEAYQLIQANKLSWMFSDCFSNPGPVQFHDGNKMERLCSLRLSPGANPLNPTSQLKEISHLCSEVRSCVFGVTTKRDSTQTLFQIKMLSGQHAYSPVTAAAVTSLRGLLDVLRTLASSGVPRKAMISADNFGKISKSRESAGGCQVILTMEFHIILHQKLSAPKSYAKILLDCHFWKDI